MTRRAPIAVATACVVLGLLVAPSAHAHEVGLSRGDYIVKGESVEAVLAFARREGVTLLPEMDADHDGSLGEAEVAAGGEAFARRVFAGVVVERDGKPCVAQPGGSRLAAEDGIEAYGAFACPGAREGAALVIELPLLTALPTGHRHLLKLSQSGSNVEAMLHRREPRFAIEGRAPSEAPPVEAVAGPDLVPPTRGGFGAGFARALLRADHLTFLIGLTLLATSAAPRARHGVRAGSAFIVACAVGLGLAGLGIVRPTPAIMEALLAASVAYVGVERFLLREAKHAPWIALAMGIAHGFAAGAAHLALAPLAGRVAPMAIFAVGLAAGQIVVVGVVSGAATLLADRIPFDRALRLVSAGIAAFGCYLFARRVLG